jgi:hypothetical protein
MRVWVLACGIGVLLSVGCGHPRSSGNPEGPTPVPVATPAPTTITWTGTVVEIGGGPVAGATIHVLQGSVDTVSDEFGAFSLTLPIVAPRFWTLQVSKSGYDPAGAYLQFTNGVKIELQRQRQVTGRVLDSVDGRPVPNLTVGFQAPQALTDSNGSFVTTAGRELRLQGNGFVSREIELPPGPQDASLGDVRIQRSIVIPGPLRLSVVLSENDPEEQFFADSDDNVSCFPCKWIDVVPGGPLQLDVHSSAAGPFVVAFVTDSYGNVTRTGIAPGGFDAQVQLPAGVGYLLIGLRTSPGVRVPLAQPVTFDMAFTSPGT